MPSLPRLKALAVSLAPIAVLVTMTACQATVAPAPKPELRFMTYNVYVGAPPDELLMVTNQADIPGKVAEFYKNYQASDFPARAAAIAKIIKESKPHVIGLQEISTVSTQTPADSQTNPGPNAEEVQQDFLKVVEAALKEEGLSYKVAGKVATFDLEMPALTSTGLIDVRLTDHDVILVRDDVVPSTTAVTEKYETELPVGSLGLSVPRGYVIVNVRVHGKTYQVVNTHLEHFDEQVRVGQTKELLARLSNEELPVILMGDFNTKATEGTAYQAIIAAGFEDVWQGEPGYTCCQADDLKNETSQLSASDGRIDLIFTKGVETRESASIKTYTVGDKPEDRTPGGLWPSDHAGVVAELPLPVTK